MCALRCHHEARCYRSNRTQSVGRHRVRLTRAHVLFSFPFLPNHGYSTVLLSRGITTIAASSRTRHSTRPSMPTSSTRSAVLGNSTVGTVTVNAASNHVHSLPVPSNQRGNGRTPPGALRELTGHGCTCVGNQPREIRHPVRSSANQDSKAAAETLQCSIHRETELDEKRQSSEFGKRNSAISRSPTVLPGPFVGYA